MTDIAALIERLRARKATWMEAIAVMEEAADALSRLTTPPIAAELETLAKDCEECAEGSEAESKYDDRRAWQSVAYRIRHAISRLTAPPPDEIARLIEELETVTSLMQSKGRSGATCKQAGATLRALSQENEKLKGIVAQIQAPNDIGDNCTAELAVKCASLEQRIRELEAERDQQEQSLTNLQRIIREQSEAAQRFIAERDATIEECAAIAEACGDTLTAEELAVEIRTLVHSERGEANDPLVSSVE